MDYECRMTDGETGLILRVPDAEHLVRQWQVPGRPTRTAGIPAHVTVLYPWLPIQKCTPDERADLSKIAAATEPFDITFTNVGLFRDVLWLDPQPAEPIRQLIATVSARWPEYPPYGGAYAEPVPHLTITDTADPGEFDRITAEIAPTLPLRVRVEELTLLVRDDDVWRPAEQFPLRAGSPAR